MPFERATPCAMLLLLLLTLGWKHASASEGDRLPLFWKCVSNCKLSGHVRAHIWNASVPTVCPGWGRRPHSSWHLQLTQWDCHADCRYQCMVLVEGVKRTEEVPMQLLGPSGQQVVKYYGKWPFTRVLGMQELCSVLFSLANLAAHVLCLKVLLQRLRTPPPTGAGVAQYPRHQASYPYGWLWVIYALISMNAWLWSAVFHTRDTRTTERFDYMSADLAVAGSLVLVIFRALGHKNRLLSAILCIGIIAGFAYHAHYMLYVKFDYGLNISICIILGLAQAAIWIVWSQLVRHPHRWGLLRFFVLLHLVMLLEILDFPPVLNLLDAHATWHATTVPLTFLFYRFIYADIDWVAGRAGVGGVAKEL